MVTAMWNVYGCGNARVGPCVPWSRYADVSDERVDLGNRLQAVLKIHRPHTPYDPIGLTQPYGEICSHCYMPYPCLTAKAAGWTPEENE